jgi:nucleoside-diphosphate-sugar epimerase
MTAPLKIVVTGAAGHLGSHLVPELLKLGAQVSGLDMAAASTPPTDGYTFVRQGLSNTDELKAVLAGAGLVVHCASLHPWKPYTDAQYIEANIQGTWNLYAAAAEVGLANIVLTSSIAALGYDAPPESWPVREERVFTLADIYSFTKHSQEDIARLFAGRGQVRTIALRPPAFFPLSNLETGFHLTGAFAIVDDIVAAHVAAVKVMAGLQTPPEPLQPFEAFFVTNQLPYTREDGALFSTANSMRPLVQKYWPQAHDWLVSQGYDRHYLPAVYDLAKARRLLGWQPAFNFEQWFEQQNIAPLS